MPDSGEPGEASVMEPWAGFNFVTGIVTSCNDDFEKSVVVVYDVTGRRFAVILLETVVRRENSCSIFEIVWLLSKVGRKHVEPNGEMFSLSRSEQQGSRINL